MDDTTRAEAGELPADQLADLAEAAEKHPHLPIPLPVRQALQHWWGVRRSPVRLERGSGSGFAHSLRMTGEVHRLQERREAEALAAVRQAIREALRNIAAREAVAGFLAGMRRVRAPFPPTSEAPAAGSAPALAGPLPAPAEWPSDKEIAERLAELGRAVPARRAPVKDLLAELGRPYDDAGRQHVTRARKRHQAAQPTNALGWVAPKPRGKRAA